MKSVDWRVHAALIFVQVAFGLFHVVAKATLSHLDPLALAAMRVLCATPLLFLLAWKVDGVLPKRRDLPLLAMLGMLGIFFNQVLFILGLQYTSATNAGILMPSIPVFTVAIGAVFGVQRVKKLQIAGIALAVGGALYMLNPLNFSLEQGKVFGNILITINCVSYSGYLVTQRPALKRLPPLTITAWAFLFGSIGIGILGVPRILATDFSALPSLVWWGILYIVLFPTTISYALNTWAVSRSSPALAAVYTTLQPVTAATFGAIFLGESSGRRELAGFVLIISGLFLVSQEMRRRKEQKSNRENHGET